MYSEQESIDDSFDEIIPIGKAKILREGSDITLISHSISLKMCLEVSKKLAKRDISCEVLDLRTIKPLDIESIITSVKKTNKCVVVEQGWSQSGVSSEIISVIMENAFDWLDAPVLRLTGKDVPMPYAENLEKLALPSEFELMKIIETIV